MVLNGLVSFVLLLLLLLFFRVQCIVYIQFADIQGNLNKEQNNNLGMISAFLVLCLIFPLPQ